MIPIPSECRERKLKYLVPWDGKGGEASFPRACPRVLIPFVDTFHFEFLIPGNSSGFFGPTERYDEYENHHSEFEKAKQVIVSPGLTNQVPEIHQHIDNAGYHIENPV